MRRGTHHTPEAKAKIKAGNTGKTLSAEARAKVSAARLGVPCATQTKEKIGAALRGRTLSLEHRAKMAAGHLGRRIDVVGAQATDPTNHYRCVWWRFENKALGAVIEGENLNRLIRENAELFPADTLHWHRPTRCKASINLRAIEQHYRNGRQDRSWKGWFYRPIGELK